MFSLFHLRQPRATMRRAHAFTLLHTVALPALLLALASNAATSRFSPIPAYPSGGIAESAITADVNGDGNLDVITSNTNGKVTLLLGVGRGSFLPPKLIATISGGAPFIAVADLNNDGKADVAVVSSPSNSVQIYLSHGDGTFAPPITESTSAKPTQVVIADVNSDGRPDLLVGCAGGFNVLLGNGNGTFHPATKVTSDVNVLLLAVGDVNGDGHPDVLTTDGNVGDREFLGKGDGTFQPGTSSGFNSFNGGESQLLLVDLDGDGKLDAVVAQLLPCGTFPYCHQTVSVAWGNGDGNFDSGVSLEAGFQPVSVAAVDLNGDGKLDLVAANAVSNSVSVLLNKGGRQFAPAVNYSTRGVPVNFPPSPPEALLTSGDLNGDGRPDLALATADGVEPLLNLGGGSLYAPRSLEFFDVPISVAAMPLNGDGHTDLAVDTAGIYTPHGISSLFALFGDGTGQFTQVGVGSFPEDGYAIPPIAGADFNHDGKLDLAMITGAAFPGVTVFLNTGHNSFSGSSFDLPNQPTMLAAGDFNNDGYADLALAIGNEVDIYLNKKDGTFTGPTIYTVGATPTFILVSDVNHDGNRDLIVTNYDSGDISVLLGKGDGSFAPAKMFSAGTHPSSVAVGDFNRDGKLDLAVGGDTMEILLGHGDGEFASPVSYPAGGPVTSLAQTDLRGNNIEDLLITHDSFRVCRGGCDSITLLYGNGDGSFKAPISYAAGTGPSWLSVGDFNDDGAPDVAVVDSGSTAMTILWNQGGTRITLKSSAATAKAGQPITFTATIHNSVPGAGTPGGTVAFKDGAKNFGFVHLNHGQAVFTTTNLSPGTHTITASYWGDGFFNPHVSSAVTEKIQP